MASLGAVVVRDATPQPLTEDVARYRRQVRELELQVLRKEAELRRAKEEQTLLRDLHTVNAMMQSKMQRRSAEGERSHLSIAPETLEELIALDDAIKIEQKKTVALDDETRMLARQVADVDRAIDTKKALLETVRQATGCEGDDNAPTVFELPAAGNEHAAKTRALAALHAEQKVVQEHSARLTNEIEQLTQAIDAEKSVDDEIARAEEDVKRQEAAYQAVLSEYKSLERLQKKKERMLDQKDEDVYKQVRQLESGKKVLHTQIMSYRDGSAKNTKSILSLESRLRQLEAQLAAVDAYLRTVFAEVDDNNTEGDDAAAKLGIAADAVDVPLTRFEELHRELNVARETIRRRDEQLDAHDAKVEQLEQKLSILQTAITSRSVSSQLQVREKEREFDTLMAHVDHVKREYEQEHVRLSSENDALRRRLAE